MRFMVIVKATEDSEAGVMPTAEQLADMGSFNESWSRPACCGGRRSEVQLAGARVTSTASSARWWTARSPKPRS